MCCPKDNEMSFLFGGSMKDWKCDGCHCDISVEDDFEHEFCCSGLREQCGCMGMPTNPVFCEECGKKLIEQINY